MALTPSDLFIPVTRDQAMSSILTTAQELGLPATSWQAGSVGRTILAVFGAILSLATQLVADLAGSGLLDYAAGEWLRLLAKRIYNVDYVRATFPSGRVQLTNTSPTSYPLTPGTLIVASRITGKKYTVEVLDNGATLAPGATLDVGIFAAEIGTASNAGAGEVTDIKTPLSGVTCTNAAPIVGLDDESDESLRQRCQDKREPVVSPAANAYDFFLRGAKRADGTPIGVTRTRVIGDSAHSAVTAYAATDTGVIDGDPNDPATDLGALNLAVQLNCVPTGITASVLSAVGHNMTIVPIVYRSARATLTAAEIKALVVDRLKAYFTTIPIGGFDVGAGGRVFRDALIGQIFQASPDILQVDLTYPPLGTDVIMAADDVAFCTTSVDDVTVK